MQARFLIQGIYGKCRQLNLCYICTILCKDLRQLKKIV